MPKYRHCTHGAGAKFNHEHCVKCHAQEIQQAIEQERASKDRAYSERNRLVALLASLFPASLQRHPEEDTTWEDDWRWVVFIALPTGQATWHIHDSDLPLFAHVQHGAWLWDGHTTEQKYERVAALVRARSQNEGEK